MLPMVAQNLALDGDKPASILMATMIAVPQLVVALLSPWVGHHSERFGRKPLLILGFGIEIIRAVLFAAFSDYSIMIATQILGGISAAAVTVLTVLVVTDLTTGNLVQGAIGTVIAFAASLSTGLSGFLFQGLGYGLGFLILAGSATLATVLLWTAMPETKPAKYID